MRPTSNRIAIDGVENDDEVSGGSRTELSPEIVQEFQVINNGISAASGGASGGAVNVVTRSGVNAMHGDAFLFIEKRWTECAPAGRGGNCFARPEPISGGCREWRRYRAGPNVLLCRRRARRSR